MAMMVFVQSGGRAVHPLTGEAFMVPGVDAKMDDVVLSRNT
jgi:hypothetical protein